MREGSKFGGKAPLTALQTEGPVPPTSRIAFLAPTDAAFFKAIVVLKRNPYCTIPAITAISTGKMIAASVITEPD